MKHILIVDDDMHINEVLHDLLVQNGYQVTCAYSGTEALYALSAIQPDLILLDLMLPGLNGEKVLTQTKGIPVIILSAKNSVEHKIALLLDGAVDYVTKPFDSGELLARIAVQMRNLSQGQDIPVLKYRDIRLHTATHCVEVCNHRVKLTKTEYAILKLLMQNPKQVISKTILLDQISEDTPDCMESSLRVHVSNLRKKIRDVSHIDYIEAIWGIGFRMTQE